MANRRLQLAWSIKEAPAVTIRVAFATTDRERVNQHFGAAEAFAERGLAGQHAVSLE